MSVVNLSQSCTMHSELSFNNNNNNDNNNKVMCIPIMIGALGTVTEGLLKGLEDLEIRGQVETIQSTTLLKLARILRRVLET